MTDPQILQLFGLIYLSIGLGMSLNSKFYKDLLGNYKDNPAMTYLTGLIVFVLGFLIVSNHNTWSPNIETTVITVLGWAALIKGFLVIILPNTMIDVVRKIAPLSKHTKTWSMIIFLIGIIISYLGFFIV
jgi:uncharacterized membrane protein